ncbi:DUF1622 domain-containing protein [Sphingomonas sp. AP4-R1]|uniref:DUF1622 domain-containing protein n=1 Tax=Sphingomonas sp. AP4-R1 TaxID=2735134 RepID=UPI0020A59205|nr:DUF1622 domain-containing protein [Sphingomonas sp. AP4-R1]
MITIDANWLGGFFRAAVIGLELAGTLTILVGAPQAAFQFARRPRASDQTEAYSAFRLELGRSISLGVEINGYRPWEKTGWRGRKRAWPPMARRQEATGQSELKRGFR